MIVKRHAGLFHLAVLVFLVLVQAAAPAGAAGLTVDKPLPSVILKDLQQAARQGLQTKKAPPSDSDALQLIHYEPARSPAKSPVIYVGAEFCPFCAALRWPLTIALMRFGHFSGLRSMLSGPTDMFPNTATLTFVHAHYRSKWVKFSPVEIKDRRGHPLQPLKGFSAKVFHKFDTAPYSSTTGGIPFVYIGGRWLLIGAPVSPHLFSSFDWFQIADKLADPDSALSKAVYPQVNVITAAICETTGGQPAKVCKAPGVVAAATVASGF
ncbi:MAG: DUF929 family protein [Gammaproteobacteria bacterium]